MDVRPDDRSEARADRGLAAEAPSVVPPDAQPQPLPEPRPLPPDWWRCHRLGSVSGRYGGEVMSPTAGRFYLDLRVDIDPRSTTSPVMERVSADLYQVFTLRLPSGKSHSWRTYVESWVIDKPQEAWSRCGVDPRSASAGAASARRARRR